MSNHKKWANSKPDPKFKDGARVRLTGEGRALFGPTRTPQIGTVIGTTRAQHVRVLWDGLKTEQVFHPELIEQAR